MAKRIGKYKVTNRESAISLVDGGTIGGNLSVSGTSTFGGVVTAAAGVLNSDVTVSSGTGAIDLTSTAADHKVFLTGTGAGQIKVPLATANNAGMCIEIYWTVDGATNGNQKLGVSNAGSTTITGGIILPNISAPWLPPIIKIEKFFLLFLSILVLKLITFLSKTTPTS